MKHLYRVEFTAKNHQHQSYYIARENLAGLEIDIQNIELGEDCAYEKITKIAVLGPGRKDVWKVE